MYPPLEHSRLLAFSFIIITTFLLKDSLTLAELQGPNVCQRTEQITLNVTRQVSTPYKATTSYLCLRPPFKCTKEKLAYKPESIVEERVHNQTFKVCCDGYAKAGNYCLPLNVSSSVVENLIQPQLYTTKESASAGSSHGLWIGTSLTLLLVVAVSILLLYRYKKKLHTVKAELNYVTYTVERGSSCASGSNYAAPSECSELNVTPNFKSNNIVHVVNQLKSDPTKASNIEQAAAMKKVSELEKDHPLLGATAMKASSSKQLFSTPSINTNTNTHCSSSSSSSTCSSTNLYQNMSIKSDKEPIYEELPDVAPDDSSSD